MMSLPVRRSTAAVDTKWRFSNIAKVKQYVLAGYTENKDIGRLLGVSAETISAWRLKYPKFEDAIRLTEAAVTVKAVNLIEESIEHGNVDTAKWWLSKRSPAFKDEKKADISTGDITVQIVNYAEESD